MRRWRVGLCIDSSQVILLLCIRFIAIYQESVTALADAASPPLRTFRLVDAMAKMLNLCSPALWSVEINLLLMASYEEVSGHVYCRHVYCRHVVSERFRTFWTQGPYSTAFQLQRQDGYRL